MVFKFSDKFKRKEEVPGPAGPAPREGLDIVPNYELLPDLQATGTLRMHKSRVVL